MAKKVAVILGAGASYDCWNDTGPPADMHWRPPLARDLFGTRPAFWDVLVRFNGARVLASELGELARGDAFNIEVKLREYAEHKDQRIRQAFKDVPLYLRDLISSVVYRYTANQHPGTHLRFVMNLLSTGAEAAFIDLNYDPYLEMALTAFDPLLLIRAIGDYTAQGRQAIICKPHGSIHWGVRMGPSGLSWDEALKGFDPQQTRGEIVVEKSQSNSIGWSLNQALLYPVLTAPLAGKGHMDLVCPEPHLEALRTFLEDCRHYVIIGTSGQDEDLLAFLREVRRTSKRPIAYYVSDSEPNARLTSDRMGMLFKRPAGHSSVVDSVNMSAALCFKTCSRIWNRVPRNRSWFRGLALG